MILQKQINVQVIIANRLVLFTKNIFCKSTFLFIVLCINKILDFILQNSRKLFRINMTYWRVSENPFPLALSLSFSCPFCVKNIFFRTRSGTITRSKSSALFSSRSVLFFVETIREYAKASDERITMRYETPRNREASWNVRSVDVCVYRRSRDADFHDETHRIGHVASRRRLFEGYGFLMRTRPSAFAFVCKVRSDFPKLQYRDCGLEAPTGDMHISSGRNEYIIHNLFRTVDL